MAIIYGSTNVSHWTFKLETSEGNYDVKNNTSPLTVRVYIGRRSSSGGSYMQGADINITVGCTGCAPIHVNYRNTGRDNIAAGGWLLVGTVTFNDVPHNPDGSKIVYVTASFTQSIVSPSSGSADGYVTLADIPRYATVEYVPVSFTDEENLRIEYDNPAGDIVDSLQACLSYDNQKRDIEYQDLDKNEVEHEFKFTPKEREHLQSWVLNVTKPERTVYVHVRTVINGESFYDSAQLTLKIVNCEPTFNPVIADINPATTRLTGDPTTIVRRKSIVSVNSGATAKKQATISNTSQFIRAGGQTLNSGSGELTNLDNGYFEFKAIDSRGVLGSHELLVANFIDYVDVTCNQNVTVALDDNGTESVAKIRLSGTYFNGRFGPYDENKSEEENDNKDNNKHFTLSYRVKEVDTEWSEQANEGWKEVTDTITTSGNSYNCNTEIAGLDYSKSYLIQCRAQDALTWADTSEYPVQIRPVFDWGRDDFNFNVPVMFKGGYNYNSIEIAENTDLNTITTPGVYRCFYSNTAATLLNCPIDQAFTLEVLPNNSLTQRITEYTASSSPKVLIRNKYRDSWGEWYEYVPRLNNLSTPVDLFSEDDGFELYDDPTKIYVFPSDGYLAVKASYRSGHYINFTLYGENSSVGINVSVTSGSTINMQGNPTNVIYVRKGMRISGCNTNDTGYNGLFFYPLS